MKRALCMLLLPFLFFVTAVGAVAQDPVDAGPSGPLPFGGPTETVMKRAGSTTVDLRSLPQTPPRKLLRPERKDPPVDRVLLPGREPEPSAPVEPGRSAPAPAPLLSFDGLDLATWGSGYPPDTVGDVGPDTTSRPSTRRSGSTANRTASRWLRSPSTRS